MIKHSIIIPTAFAKCDELLVPCVESILQFTDLSETEIIVVSNGCTDHTDQYVLSRPEVRLVSFSQAIGYPQAINEGIKSARGEFVIPFNNDNILLPQNKNEWIQTLVAPFSDPQVMMSGPWKNHCEFSNRDFLIFFVVMIRKSLFEIVGMLDAEAFGEGYGEDCDMCCKAEDAGFRVVQVPEESKLPYDGQMATGYFPIYHAGNRTFRNWPEGDKLLAKNRQILTQRYNPSMSSVNIEKAKTLDGYMFDEELLWLAEQARKSKIFIEVGSWHGKSTRAIGDNLPEGAKFYAVDTWKGSVVEQETNHVSAGWMDGDHAFHEFATGLWDLIAEGRVTPLRMHSKNAADLFKKEGLQADCIFIDAGHTYEEAKEDILAYLPLLKLGGTICGHDFINGMWPGVTDAVGEIFGMEKVGNPKDTMIWTTDYNPLREEKVEVIERPRIYDCCTFFNELELLEIRLNELDPVVERFIIVEATATHQRESKPLYFKENESRFSKFLHKISHIVVDFPSDLQPFGGPSFPPGENWALERYQREAIMWALKGCHPDDAIIISDADEIASAKAVDKYRSHLGLCYFVQNIFYYYLNYYGGEWRESKILPYDLLQKIGPCGARYSMHVEELKTQGTPLTEGGWHFSFMGGLNRVKQKIQSYSHAEYNRPEILETERLERLIEEGRDVFGREDQAHYQMVEIDSTYPKYIRDNLDYFKQIGFIKCESPVESQLKIATIT